MEDSAERNRATILKLLTHIVNGEVDAAMELVHEDYVEHNPTIGQGRPDLRKYLQTLAEQDPAPEIRIERVMAKSDQVVVRLHTLWKTDRPSTTAVDFFRLRDDLIVEHWDIIHPYATTT